jgi:predicted CXXCH cytochrome family protein
MCVHGQAQQFYFSYADLCALCVWAPEGRFPLKPDLEVAALLQRSSRRLLSPAMRRTLRTCAASACIGVMLFAATPGSADSTPKSDTHAKKNDNKKKHAVQAAAPAPVMRAVSVKASNSPVAPLPASEKIVSNHAPYDAGDCSICHKNNDVQNPGPLKSEVNELCMSCHDNFQKTMSRKYVHAAAQAGCTNCHNPHNSKQDKLLLEETGALCLGCHDSIKQAAGMPVKHDALTQGKQCVNCHNPHGADVEHLLVQMPMQLCLQCHGGEQVADHNGKKLTNMTKLLADNPHQHGPVAAQDCSACHMPHGSNNFRLLTNAYPPQFYSGYDSKNYALCFGCHDEQAFTTPETEQLTQFRNGKKNLHYVHVNRSEMGRTCRACHEVHASVQEHQIRDAVPFGPKGWMLKINFTKTETGGSCAKTCHATRSYNNSQIKAAAATPQTAAAAPETKADAAVTGAQPAAPVAAEAKPAAPGTEAPHDAKP